MNKITIGIIGFGMVGRAIHHGFAQTADFRIYDVNPKISENTLEEVVEDSDFIFICVPTPMKKDTGECDISILEDTIRKCAHHIGTHNMSDPGTILIIKSTIPPRTTQKLDDTYGMIHLVFNPEFLTARTSKLDFINSSRIILGGDKEDVDKVEELYRMRFPATPIFKTDTKTAELAKYTANCFFATKLSFFNEIHQVCDKLDIDYNELIKLVISDNRIGNSHYTVPGQDGDYGFGALCFPKDLNSLIYKEKELGVKPTVLEAVWKKNLEVRKKYDWLKIKGAVSS